MLCLETGGGGVSMRAGVVIRDYILFRVGQIQAGRRVPEGVSRHRHLSRYQNKALHSLELNWFCGISDGEKAESMSKVHSQTWYDGARHVVTKVIELIQTQSVWMTRNIYTRKSPSYCNNPALRQCFKLLLWKWARAQGGRLLLTPFHLPLFKHHQTARPLCGRRDTCDGSQLFTYHSSLETFPCTLKK